MGCFHLAALWTLVGTLLAGGALAQVPAILIEACSLIESAAKRVECLQAANQVPGRAATQAQPVTMPRNVLAATPTAPALPSVPRPNTSFAAPSGATCYVGPRGGTYTITKSGKKNYSGC